MVASVVETHVSFLVFFDDIVLKYKKPVLLPFLDLRSLQARAQLCAAEVAANRRLAPDVYLGVADVVIERQDHHVDSGQAVGHGADGERQGPTPWEQAVVLDHAVVMRRLPDEANLAQLVEVRSDDLSGRIEELAGVLADFYARARRDDDVDAAGTPAAIRGIWSDLLAPLERHARAGMVSAGSITAVRTGANRFIDGRGELFSSRIADRRIVDGHGDLLASDIFLMPDGPRVLDCVEFDERLRHVDVLADIAFLVMDLEHRGAPDLGRRFLDAYVAESKDSFPPTLVHFYVAQRAVTRALVCCERAVQQGAARSPEAQAFIDLAATRLQSARVVLGAVSGLPGAGKSTVARGAAERLGWPVLRSDEIRRELFAGRDDAYSEEATTRTYEELLGRASRLLRLGRSVVMDATFSSPRWQQAAERLAADTSSDLVVIGCWASPGVAEERLRRRAAAGTDLSEAGVEVLAALARRARPWAAAVPLDTTSASVEVLVDAAVERLCRAPTA